MVETYRKGQVTGGRHAGRTRLATSREALGIGGEAIYRVPPMSLPGPGEAGPAAAASFDALALFADRARAQGVGLSIDQETTPLVISICRQLDGLPLAIELAAARLRSLSLPAIRQLIRLIRCGRPAAATGEMTSSGPAGADR
jgi:predicted ATPase